MAQDEAGFVFSSEWVPGAAAGGDRYRLTFANRSGMPLAGFRLGLSGHVRLGAGARVTGATIVTQLSGFCELAPPPGFVLAPGAQWEIEVEGLDYPVRHWTDGVASAFVIGPDNAVTSALTLPAQLAGSAGRNRRGTVRMPVPDAPPVPVAIVPWPQHVEVNGRRDPPSGLAPLADDDAGADAMARFADLAGRLFAGEALVRPVHAGGLPVRLATKPGRPAEGYGIDFAGDEVRIEAATATGLFYGLVTLGQILRGARSAPQAFRFPARGRIEDAPEMTWRGCHLDVARQFYAPDEIAQFLAILAWNKLNRFHWHLSDDEGFRVESAAFPALARTAAWRGHGLALPPLLGSGAARSGGYYTREEVGRLVALAGSWGIEVIAEIDVPGHCHALLEALPALRDPGENGGYASIQGFPNNALNPAVERVYEVVETLFGELLELFPSRWFHVGADEVAATAWQASPAANALRRENGLAGAAPLQALFLRRIQSFLTAHGRITGAWEEAAEGGGIARQDCYLVGWHTVEASRRLAAQGYDVVVAPGQAYYLDMALSADWHEPGAAWAGSASLAQTYGFAPAAGWSAAESRHLLGVQACIWSEPMFDRAVFDRLVFPRLSAIAEAGWTAPDRRDFDRFSALAGLMPNLYGQHEGA